MKTNALLVTILFILTSCATWRTGEIDTEFSFDGHEKQESKVKMFVEFGAYEYYENEELNKDWLTESKKTRVEKIIFDRFRKTKLFKILTKEESSKLDYKAVVEVRRYLKYSENMQWVTPLSLYLIPRSVEDKIVVTVKFYDNKNALVGMTEAFDKAVTWHQLFMILGLPFTGTPNNQVMNAIEDLVMASVEQAYQDGYFNGFENL